MREFNDAAFANLLGDDAKVKVSITIPTHSSGQEVLDKHDAINFKTELQKVKNALKDTLNKDKALADNIKEAEKLIDDKHFWHHQQSGLAVFISANQMKVFHSPIELETFSGVSHQFYLRQVITLLNHRHPFYILALSKNKPRLFSCEPYQIVEMETNGIMPKDFETALRKDDPQSSLQFRTGHNRSENANFHGHGSSKDAEKDELMFYFREVNEAVTKILTDNPQNPAPLMLACVEYYFPIYQKANTYGNLYGKVVEGNPDMKKLKDLHRDAFNIIKDDFNEDIKKQVAQFNEMLGTGKASADARKIMKAAKEERVKTLFITKHDKVWGSYNPESHEVGTVEEANPLDFANDLVNEAAILTFKSGGTVYLVPDEWFNGSINGSESAALFRY